MKVASIAQAGYEIPKSDAILLRPQVRFMLKKLTAKTDRRAIRAIDMAQYDVMDAKGMLINGEEYQDKFDK